MNWQKVGGEFTNFLTAIIGVAIVAVILSNGSDTVQVLQNFFSTVASLVQIIISPIQGGAPVNVLGGSGTTNPAFTPVGSSGSNAGTGAAGAIGAAGSILTSTNNLLTTINSASSLSNPNSAASTIVSAYNSAASTAQFGSTDPYAGLEYALSN